MEFSGDGLLVVPEFVSERVDRGRALPGEVGSVWGSGDGSDRGTTLGVTTPGTPTWSFWSRDIFCRSRESESLSTR